MLSRLLQIRAHLGKDDLGLFNVKVGVLAFFNAVLLQLVMPVCGEPMTCQATFDAYQGAAIQRHNGTPGLGDLHQIRHITPYPGDAGHFSQTTAVQLQSHMVRQLRRTGAA